MRAFFYLKGPSVIEDIAQLLERMGVDSEVLGAPEVKRYDGESAGFEKMGRPGKNMPGSNQAQNEQTRSLSKKYGLSKDQQRKLHDRISGKDYSFGEIENIIRNKYF